MKMLMQYLLLGLAFCACSGSGSGSQNGSGKENPEPAQPTDPVETPKDAYVYTTTADRSKLFEETTVSFGSPSTMSPYVVKFTGDTYQTLDGFGAAVTVSSCYNLLKMTEENRTRFLKQVFDTEEGLGSSLIRICIGGSDFSWDYSSGFDGRFTWCDDEGIEHFAPHPVDVKYVVPVLKEIFAINPSVRIIGSPWTAPRWMKLDENLQGRYDSWTGGRLNPAYYQDYATYFVKWIQYFEGQGFPIYAITPENEPLNAGNSMSMLMPWEDCRDFVKTALGPALEEAGLKTKILIFDHNYNYDNKADQEDYPLKVYADQEDYPLKVYADPEAAKYIAGSAWHNYGGSVTELDQIVREAPDKEIFFTEASIGAWNYSFDSCTLNDFRDIFLGTMARGGKGVTLWNLMLDDKRGPYTPADGSCTTCYGAVTIASSDYTAIEPLSHYYDIAHCSKVIRQDAVRIGTTGFTANGLTYQAFRNPDGSYGVVILNEGTASRQLVFATDAHSVKCDVPAKALVSLKWKE